MHKSAKRQKLKHPWNNNNNDDDDDACFSGQFPGRAG